MYAFTDRITNRNASGQINPFRNVVTICRRHIREISDCVHDETAMMYSNNLVHLAIIQREATISSIVMYLTEKSFFGSESMAYLMDKMLSSETVGNALMYSGVLQTNFYMHPPCAKYMVEEYHKLMLVPSEKYFNKMVLWEYIIDHLNKIIDGSCFYGDNADADMGFKKCFTFCLTILQYDHEVSSMNKVMPLMKKCLNYKPERIIKPGGLINMLNILFNTKSDLQVLAIDLAVLINCTETD